MFTWQDIEDAERAWTHRVCNGCTYRMCQYCEDKDNSVGRNEFIAEYLNAKLNERVKTFQGSVSISDDMLYGVVIPKGMKDEFFATYRFNLVDMLARKIDEEFFVKYKIQRHPVMGTSEIYGSIRVLPPEGWTPPNDLLEDKK